MPKRGGYLAERLIDDGLWSLAYRNSNGSYMDVVNMRYYYGMRIGFFLFVLPVTFIFILMFFVDKDPNHKPPINPKK
jgi:hypothetical protein